MRSIASPIKPKLMMKLMDFSMVNKKMANLLIKLNLKKILWKSRPLWKLRLLKSNTSHQDLAAIMETRK